MPWERCDNSTLFHNVIHDQLFIVEIRFIVQTRFIVRTIGRGRLVVLFLALVCGGAFTLTVCFHINSDCVNYHVMSDIDIIYFATSHCSHHC